MLKSLALLGLATLGSARHSIHDFGAVHADNSLAAIQANSMAFEQAILKANSSLDDREVYIPYG